jgi:Uncharacterised nucleotidyltransferase
MPIEQGPPFEIVCQTLKRCAATLRDADIPFLVGGSSALWARGGPRYVEDLDFIVKPEDAERALDALVDAGLEPLRPPEEWLLKARDGDVEIDVIYEPSGFTIDDAVLGRGDDMDVVGMSMPVMALEDIFTTKLLSLKEHYLDYEGLLPFARALREQVDWGEVRSRTSESPFAKAFFTLIEELGIVPRESASAG